MATNFFVRSIWKKVQIVNKTFFKIFKIAFNIIEIFETKGILLSAILSYNYI